MVGTRNNTYAVWTYKTSSGIFDKICNLFLKFPAILTGFAESGRDDNKCFCILLLNKNILQKIWVLRNYLTDMNAVEAMEFLRDRLMQAKSNEEFLISMNGG